MSLLQAIDRWAAATDMICDHRCAARVQCPLYNFLFRDLLKLYPISLLEWT